MLFNIKIFVFMLLLYDVKIQKGDLRMSKKRNNIIFMIIFTLLLACLPANNALATSTMNLYYYGTKDNVRYTGQQVKFSFNGSVINMKDTPGIIRNGIAFASFKDVFVDSGMKINYNYVKSTGTLTLSQNHTTIVFKIGSKKAYVNGNAVTIPAAPISVKYKEENVSKLLVPTWFVAKTFGYIYTWNSTSASVAIKSPLNLYYNKKVVAYTGTIGKVSIDGKKINLGYMPSIIVNNTAIVRAKSVFSDSSIGADYNYNKSTRELTLKKGSNVVVLTMDSPIAYVNGIARVMDTSAIIVKNLRTGLFYVMVPGNSVSSYLGYKYTWDSALKTSMITKIVDRTAPTISLKYSVINQAATITSTVKDNKPGVLSVKYLKGNITDINSEKWDATGKELIGTNKFIVKSSGNYSVLVEDLAGNRAIKVINVVLEFKAVWISYLEFLSYGKGGFTEESFATTIDTMFDNIADMNMNAVVVQIRPFGDAMYESSYFPWSKYISGTQGVDPGFDPLEYMVKAAHERGLEFHAWLNPYRVTLANTDYSKLAVYNPARIWHEDNDLSNDRNVLSFDGNLYYNPASKEVQTLITNGIKEIVNNYDVDGIHFDDYFYPVLGTKYATTFDNIEYKKYVVECNTKGKTILTIADWRRNNINTLIKNIYKSIKNIDSSVQFGISPGGFINILFSNAGYYVDIKTWLSSDGYIDYICPQIYWSFSNSSYPFDTTLDRWLSYRTSSSVKMYVGIATYKAGSSLEADWKNDDDVLANQVEYGRNTRLVDGFVFYRYDFFYNKVTKPGVDKLLEIIQ